MSNIQHAFHPVEISSLGAQQIADPVLDESQVNKAILGDAHAAHGRVVLMFAIGIQELCTTSGSLGETDNQARLQTKSLSYRDPSLEFSSDQRLQC